MEGVLLTAQCSVRHRDTVETLRWGVSSGPGGGQTSRS